MKSYVVSWLFICLGVYFPVLLNAETLQSREPNILPTIVITNFTVHENSFRSIQEAVKLTELAQIDLMDKTSYRWVEREQLRHALAELKMSSMGLFNSSASLQLGKWLKADLLIKGDFYRNKDYSWIFIIEIIDLEHADILLSKSLSHVGRKGVPFHNHEQLASNLCVELIPMITEAHQKWMKTKKDIRIAPLFFQNAEPGGRLDFYEKDLFDMFSKSQGLNLRYLCFPRADESIQEAELVVSGLAESDPQAWKTLSDYYVWGAYQEVNASGIPFDEVRVKAVITLWDGFNKPFEFSEQGTVSKLPDMSARIISRITAYAAAKTKGVPQSDIRSKIANDLAQRARDIQELVVQTEYENHPGISKTWWKRREYAVQLLSTAAFFDPANENIRTQLLVESTRDDIDDLTRVVPTVFWRKWARSEAWGKHCETFGFNYEHIHAPKLKRGFIGDNRLFRGDSAHMYIYSVLQLIEECKDYKTRTNSQTSIPTDIPADVAQQWQAELSKEYGNRLYHVAVECPEKIQGFSGEYLLALLQNSNDTKLQVKIIDLLWPDAIKNSVLLSEQEYVIRRINEIYSVEKNPSGSKEIIEKLREGKFPGVRRSDRSNNEVVHELNKSMSERKPVVVSSTAPTDTIQGQEITIATVKINAISFREYFYVQEETAMVDMGSRLWVAVRGQKLNENFDQGSAIFIIDYKTNKIFNLSKRLGNHSEVTSFYPDKDKLWVTFSSDGVWAIDTTTLKVTKYTERDGLTSNEMFCSCGNQDKIVFAGGMESIGTVCAFDKSTQKWIKYDLPPVPGDKANESLCRIREFISNDQGMILYSYYESLLQFNLIDNKWNKIGEMLLSQELGFRSYKTGTQVGVLGFEKDNQDIWIIMSKGISLFNPASLSYKYMCLSSQKITSYCADENTVWIARTNTPFNQDAGYRINQGAHLLCFDKSTHKWLYRIEIPYGGKVCKMIKTGSRLWVGMSNNEQTLLSIDL
jgi:hypothetical protein